MSLNVIALGGNAILDTDPTDEGQKVVNHAAKYIAEFVARGTSHCLSRKRTTSREFAFTTKSRRK